jgi:hypothetical protein
VSGWWTGGRVGARRLANEREHVHARRQIQRDARTPTQLLSTVHPHTIHGQTQQARARVELYDSFDLNGVTKDRKLIFGFIRAFLDAASDVRTRAL